MHSHIPLGCTESLCRRAGVHPADPDGITACGPDRFRSRSPSRADGCGRGDGSHGFRPWSGARARRRPALRPAARSPPCRSEDRKFKRPFSLPMAPRTRHPPASPQACQRRCSDTVKSTVRTPGTALDRAGRLLTLSPCPHCEIGSFWDGRKHRGTILAHSHSIINGSRKSAWLNGLAVIDMSLYRRFYRQENTPFAGAGWRGIGSSSISFNHTEQGAELQPLTHAICARMVKQAPHQLLMGRQQVPLAAALPFRQVFIGRCFGNPPAFSGPQKWS